VDEEGVPTFNRGDSFIYEPYILLFTWYALNQGQAAAVEIPGDIEKLIETVYAETLKVPNDVSAAFAARLQKTWREMKNPQMRAVSQAQGVLIPSPWREDIYIQFNQQLEEDNPDAHTSLQAKTRDGEPSLPVILLDADAPRLKRSAEPSLDDARTLLGYSINLSHKGLLKAIRECETVPSGWARTPWLRNYRVIRLDAEGKATYRSGDGKRAYTLHLNPTLGVSITSRTGERR
jgi:CRISPR-associated endonuclease/helicase Cas3